MNCSSMWFTTCLSVMFSFGVQMTVDAQEIGFVEEFALAGDRTVPLAKLIPGTQDYYYYHCLHLQNEQQFDKAEEMLAAWQKRHKGGNLQREIQYRQALLTYDRDPQKTLGFLERELGLGFGHQRDRLNKTPRVPSVLNPELLGRDRLMADAFRKSNLGGFEDSALHWLMSERLDADRRRALLSRLQRPDYDNLVKLIVADLQHKNSGGFGSLAIHTRLLKSQLDQLMKQRPGLRNETKFVNAYIARLAPSADVDLQQDIDEHAAWLDRLYDFAKTLNASHNSLKAHVLYHRLVLDQQTGNRSRARFLDYIRIPRKASYVNPKWLRSPDVSRQVCDLGRKFDSTTQLKAVGNDEALVRDYLLSFFVKDSGYKDFEAYLSDEYLKHVFAEAKIVNGLGDGEQLYSLLPPAKYQQLKERVDIDFAATNAKFYSPDESVALDVSIKNVPTLIVKVFEINTLNYHRENQRDVNTDINLDGLVANDEQTYEYSEPPLRRVNRRFEFPKLNKRGTYVIDFIGNGQSSRALVRKGQLRFLVKTTSVGHAFTVLDENDKVVQDASLLLGGQQYDAIDGRLLVPFSSQSGRKKIVVSTPDGFSSLGEFEHKSEAYSLSAGMHVDRESLLRQRKSKLLVRPQLTLNGVPVSLNLLQDVKLVVTSTDHDGTNSRQEITDFELFEDRESVHEFGVPLRLASLSFTLSANVKLKTTSKDKTLSASHSVNLNRIDKTEKISDIYLLKSGEDFVLEMRGRSGELRSARPVSVQLKHRDYKRVIQQSLATNDAGQVMLGKLENIDNIVVKSDGLEDHRWDLLDDRHTYYRVMHAKAGEAVRVPWMGAGNVDRSLCSLLETRGGNYVADHFSSVQIADGFLKIDGLQAGDYELSLYPKRRMLIRVSDGEVSNGFVLGRNRQLQQRGENPLQVESVVSDDKQLTIKLANASKFARVHLFATRYVPEFDAFQELAVYDVQPFAQRTPRRALSAYIEGRNIGDEYRYILERRHQKRFPGNMNERPGMLLNPFVLRSTDTGQQLAAKGGEFAPSAPVAASMMDRMADGAKAEGQAGGFASLDFLPGAAVVAVNLVADENGTITVALKDLGKHQHIHVVAIDPLTTVSRTINLAAPDATRIDLRLAASLDPKKHFNQSKEFRFLGKGETLKSKETASMRMEIIDSLSRAYQLYATLNQHPHLAEFEFLLRWPTLDQKEKQTLYSKYACHELNFFVAQKDPEFFQQIVQPYLQNKMHKTFMDHYLLGDDLSAWLHPWAHARLNVAEQILLADRIDGEVDRTRMFIRQRYDILPVDVSRSVHLFDTAFGSQGLVATGGMGGMGGGGGGALGFAAPSFGFAGKDMYAGQDIAGGRVLNESLSLGVDVRGLARKKRKSGSVRSEKLSRLSELEDLEELGVESESRFSQRGRQDKSQVFFDDADMDGLAEAQNQLYRKLESTQEWVENNYYKLPIEQQLAELVRVNAFWKDFAARDRNRPFVSANVLEASHSFTEIMLALAVLDLPFESPEHQSEIKDGVATFTAAGPMIVALDEIRPAEVADDASSILVSQNFYKHNDRYRHVGNQQLDKFLTKEFIVNTVYGCQIAVTNPTSSPQSLTLVLQVPEGAIPVLNSQYTKRVPTQLKPFTTQTIDYYFYFPADGQFNHYPVQVTDSGNVIAFAEAAKFNVVEEPTSVDTESWDHVSQFASADQVIQFLKTQNLQRVDLSRIAWRMKDADFFNKVTQLLHERHTFNDVLWSYAIKHNVQNRIEEYLASNSNVVSRVGMQMDSSLLKVNPIDRHTYQHRDYSPLVNARAHKLGAQRTILNDRYRAQYQSLAKLLSYQREFDDEQRMAITYYLLLQDRVEDAMEIFAKVNPDNVAAKIQYDYCAAYLDFFDDEPTTAKSIVDKYADYPVDRWRNLFAAMKSQLDEIDGEQPATIDPEKTGQVNTLLAASDCSFDLEVDNKEVAIDFQNVEQLTVNYYLMDIELLFSKNPFVQQYGNRFANIRPNLTQTVDLPKNETKVTFDMPADLRNSNLLVEVVGRGMKKTAAYYSNSLSLQLIENYGQVKVTDTATGKPLSRVYVKAYARMNNGQVKFYKDGYTDLRGRFDYASLNTNELDQVERFSVLVLSDSHGATVRESDPPQR